MRSQDFAFFYTCLLISPGDGILIVYQLNPGSTTHVGFSGPLVFWPESEWEALHMTDRVARFRGKMRRRSHDSSIWRQNSTMLHARARLPSNTQRLSTRELDSDAKCEHAKAKIRNTPCQGPILETKCDSTTPDSSILTFQATAPFESKLSKRSRRDFDSEAKRVDLRNETLLGVDTVFRSPPHLQKHGPR